MRREVYTVEGMSCAACAAAVERVTRKLEGVARSDVNLTTNKLDIEYDEAKLAPADIMAQVEKAGFHAAPLSAPKPEKQALLAEAAGEKRRVVAALVLSAALLYVAMGPMLFPDLPMIAALGPDNPMGYALLQMVLALPILFLGRRIFRNGFKALWHLNPNMDSLVAIGSACSFLYSLVMLFLMRNNPAHLHHLYFESSAIVVSLVMLGKFMESGSKKRTMSAIEKLTEMTPDTAVLIEANGEQREVAADTLRVGDTVLIKPGARVPMDGVVQSGTGGVDESMLTGESIPVFKQPDDPVVGGSLNQNGALYVRITRVGEDTTLARIIRFVEDAQGKKAPIAKTADKVAGVFVPVVIGLAIAAAAIWLIMGESLSFALQIFTSVLVIACPCAMGLATPTAVVVGTGLGASHGILIRSGEALESTHAADVVVLDKTGTVTEGKPAVTEVYCAMPEAEFLALAALAESVSAHPLSAAVTEYAARQGYASPLAVADFESVAGRGVRAGLSDGKQILAGSQSFLEKSGITAAPLAAQAAAFAARGETLVFVAVDGAAAGVIGISDAPRQSSAAAIARLKEMGLQVVLLTGDNQAAADACAASVGADAVIAEVLPEDKAAAVKALQEDGHTVMMVGDGVNDAPALAQADIGCAIGGGSDVAIESADIVLMKSDLADVPRAIRLSRLTLRNIRENLFWAFCYNTVGIPVAAGVLYPLFGVLLNPMLAGLAMSLSSVCVVSNALRLKGKKL